MKLRWPGFLLIAVILGAWEFSSAEGWLDPVAFPRVSVVVSAWAESIASGVLPQELLRTLARVFTGLGLAIVVGIPLGLLMGTVPFIYRLMEPITEFLRPIPSSAYIPISILFLGIGNEMKVFAVFVSCYFPILLNTLSGIRGTDPILIDTGRTFSVSRLKSLTQIVFPAAFPSILTGIRISLGTSLIVCVVAEMIIGNSGMGYFILNAQRIFRTPDMFAGIFMLGVVGFLINMLFLRVERHFLRWRISGTA